MEDDNVIRVNDLPGATEAANLTAGALNFIPQH